MTYVNTIERVALRREREEGKQEGAAALLATLITSKFGTVPHWTHTRLAAADEIALSRSVGSSPDARPDDVGAETSAPCRTSPSLRRTTS